MRAIVCDCCGKVILLPDSGRKYGDTGIHHLVGDTLDRTELDLCQDCVDKLMKAVREVKA